MTMLARRTDPETSHLAAEALTNRRIIRDTVFAHLLECPSTDHELTDWYFSTLGLPVADLESPRKRRSELTSDGLVIATASRRRAPGMRTSQIVWAVSA